MFANMTGKQFDIDVFRWSADAYSRAGTAGPGMYAIGAIETMLRGQCNAAAPCRAGFTCLGVCIRSCDSGQACPVGYGCDDATKSCISNPTPCSATACGGGTTCVQNRCVPSCKGSACGAGEVCVSGGCLPDDGQVAIGLAEIKKLTTSGQMHCTASQSSNVQAIARCEVVTIDAGGEAGIDAAPDADAALDAPNDATGN
jgi:hypothetical protein